MANLLQPLPKDSFNPALARHLMNRAGFGVPAAQLDIIRELTLEEAVDYFVQFDKIADNAVVPDVNFDDTDIKEMRAMADVMTEDERKAMKQQARMAANDVMRELVVWWFRQMRDTTRPLQEKLVLFWHGHFATSAEKVKEPSYNWDIIHNVFRHNAVGNFKTLTTAVGQSPAMLRYLDNLLNRKGHPNENWARELMELFTLGIGHYTEADIKESARAFTGWKQAQGEFFEAPRFQDEDLKTFLGKTGNFHGQDVIDIIFEQPAAATHICRKLWEFFAYEDPEDEIVEGLAATLRAAKFELRPMLRQLFLSRAFYAPRAVGTQIKSPLQFAQMLLDTLDIDPQDGTMLEKGLMHMGQGLFMPPNVKGWPGNRAWINTNTLLLRYNLTGMLLQGKISLPNKMGREKTRPMGGDVAAVFAGCNVMSVGAAVDALCGKLLGRAPDAEQRRALISALAPGADAAMAWTSAKPRPENQQAFLHLALSIAEYQLC